MKAFSSCKTRTLLATALLQSGALLLGTPPAHAAETACPVSIRLAGLDTKRANMGDQVAVKIENLSDAIDKCQLDARKLVLYLNGRALKGVHGEPINRSENLLGFSLNRTSDSRAAWSLVIGSPTDLNPRKVRVGVGFDDAQEIPLAAPDKKPILELVIFRDRWFAISSLILVLFVGLFIWLARSSEIIRDRVPGKKMDQKAPFSLARFQMAAWFLLVVGAFLYIYSITGEYNAVITAQSLILIGISTFTTLLAGTVDNGKQSAVAPLKQSLEPAMNKLQGEIAKLQSKIDALKVKTDAKTATPEDRSDFEKSKNQLEQKNANLQALKKPVNDAASGTWSTPSKNFINDVLTDSGGISLHRFQLFTWTIVLGAVFIYEVWKSLTLPEFDATLLSLMGISSGTYLGFKIPEKH